MGQKHRWTNSRASSCDSTLAGEGNGAVRLYIYIYIYISLSLLYIYIYLCASTSISHSLSTSLYLTVDTERCIYVHCGSATHMANRHCAYGSAARCPRLAHYTLQAFVRPSPTASPIRDRPSGRGARLPFPLLLSFPLSRSLSLSFSLALSLSLIYIYTEREIYIFFFSLYRRRPISTQSYPSFRSWLRCAMPRPTTIHPPSVHLPRLSATAPPVQSGDCGLLGLPTCTAPSLTGTCPAERISPSPLLSYCVITQRWPQACETVPLTPGQRGVSSAVCF